jgi:hypothetical protein
VAVTDPASRLQRLINETEARFNREFLGALRLIRNQISLNDLADLIEQGRFEEAFESVLILASRLNVVWSSGFVDAGTSTAAFLTNNVPDIVIDFDQTNERGVQAMRDNRLRLVSEFTDQQRRATNQAMVTGFQEGQNPRQMARRFRNSIGLTARQERTVRNYERALRTLDRDALRRSLRDRRFDSNVARAIADQEPLSERQISRMVTRFRERAIALRSRTIARTEALRSVHQGVDEMYGQAIESGQLQPDQLIRIWNTALDERVRDFANGASTSHASMHDQERQFLVPFTSGAGRSALSPGQFNVPDEDINCRCNVSTRILTPAEAAARGIRITVLQG